MVDHEETPAEIVLNTSSLIHAIHSLTSLKNMSRLPPKMTSPTFKPLRQFTKTL